MLRPLLRHCCDATGIAELVRETATPARSESSCMRSAAISAPFLIKPLKVSALIGHSGCVSRNTLAAFSFSP